jgi:hypothetical protein
MTSVVGPAIGSSTIHERTPRAPRTMTADTPIAIAIDMTHADRVAVAAASPTTGRRRRVE